MNNSQNIYTWFPGNLKITSCSKRASLCMPRTLFFKTPWLKICDKSRVLGCPLIYSRLINQKHKHKNKPFPTKGSLTTKSSTVPPVWRFPCEAVRRRGCQLPGGPAPPRPSVTPRPISYCRFTAHITRPHYGAVAFPEVISMSQRTTSKQSMVEVTPVTAYPGTIGWLIWVSMGNVNTRIGVSCTVLYRTMAYVKILVMYHRHWPICLRFIVLGCSFHIVLGKDVGPWLHVFRNRSLTHKDDVS